MSEQIITQRIQDLSPEYRAFVESNFLEIASRTFGEANGFTSRKVEILENAITFYLLFLFDIRMTIDFISRNCELSSEEASVLFTAIRSSLPEGLDEMIQNQASLLQNNPRKGLATEIAQTERDLESLQGIRTMATDMREVQANGVPTYQSSQSDLIQPSTPLPPSNGPRWETDK